MMFPFTIPEHEAERQLYLRRLKLLSEYGRIVSDYHITDPKVADGNDTELYQKMTRQLERRYPDVLLPSDVANELKLIHHSTYEEPISLMFDILKDRSRFRELNRLHWSKRT